MFLRRRFGSPCSCRNAAPHPPPRPSLPERVLLPPQLCSDCGQWSMVSSPFVSPTQSKQFETCELLQPRNFTLVPLSELLRPPTGSAKRKKGPLSGNYGTGETPSTGHWSSYWSAYGFSTNITDARKTHGWLVFSSAFPRLERGAEQRTGSSHWKNDPLPAGVLQNLQVSLPQKDLFAVFTGNERQI